MARFSAVRAALLLLGLAACHRAPAEPKVVRAWVRLAAVTGRPAAAYFTIQGDRRTERLIRIETALARDTEMHGTQTGGGLSAMTRLEAVVIPAGGTVMFAPGRRHAMLAGLDPVVTAGTAVPLRFGFASGRTAEAEAKTVAAGEDAPY